MRAANSRVAKKETQCRRRGSIAQFEGVLGFQIVRHVQFAIRAAFEEHPRSFKSNQFRFDLGGNNLDTFHMIQPRPIGILGGMGPEATILLQRRLLSAVPARDDADHVPLLIDMNPQVPSRIAHLIEGKGEDPGPTLAAMARRLQTAGAVALAMPCNTAHHYAGAITAAVDIPFLNMVDLAADHAAEALGAGGRVGMLASPAVRYTRLFETALDARGLSVVWPERDEAMLAAIRAIKSHGACAPAREALHAASADLSEAGVEFQFVACSEFSLIADSVAPGVRAVDTVDVLARAIIDFATMSQPGVQTHA